MKLRRVRAVARKEFLHIVRDLRSLGMAIAIPMLMLILFGSALTVDVDDVPTVVWDQSGTQASREFLSRFGGSPYFSIVGYERDYEALEQAIDTRRALAALVVPSEFAERIETGRRVAVQMIVDGSDSNTATMAIAYGSAGRPSAPLWRSARGPGSTPTCSRATTLFPA
jgi:ABC-2 type transport system permease protein